MANKQSLIFQILLSVVAYNTQIIKQISYQAYKSNKVYIPSVLAGFAAATETWENGILFLLDSQRHFQQREPTARTDTPAEGPWHSL